MYKSPLNAPFCDFCKTAHSLLFRLLCFEQQTQAALKQASESCFDLEFRESALHNQNCVRLLYINSVLMRLFTGYSVLTCQSMVFVQFLPKNRPKNKTRAG
ncbi:hypothetical protein HMPREF9248_0019 [Fannyhessea vaginae PB189-T1-4]|uniref:Uncharacterized protein n=1 Tax=Fannyhessea vaginae PB189-T1-4 TaxID=866774 RepID=A0ABN0B1K2_9ACTN|nr:hypothetical protein HMPREF9248_0019 [Fannyhessea vaginae PB189-T1-4]